MAISRPPRVNGTLTNYQSYPYQYWNPDTSGPRSNYDVSERSFRPDYQTGGFSTLPGGKKFRTSTSYQHRYWAVVGGEPSIIRGYTRTKRDPGSYTAAVDSRYFGFFANLSGYFLCIAENDQSMRNEAATKALNKLADQKVNLGENLATMGQTYRMFASKGLLLADALRSAYKNKSWRPFLTKSLKDLKRAGVDQVIAQSYLEYVYGLKPLMQDVYEVVKMMQGQSAAPALLKAVGSSQRTTTFLDPRVYSSGYAKASIKSRVTNSKGRCTIWARLDPNGRGLRALNQLGLLNPISLAYELMSWSFVIDWFIPAGQVFQALTAPAGLIYVDGSMSWKHNHVETWFYDSDTIDISDIKVLIEFRQGSFTVQKEVYRRDVLGGWPVPGFWIDPDPFRGDRSAKALALAVTNLGNLRKSIR